METEVVKILSANEREDLYAQLNNLSQEERWEMNPNCTDKEVHTIMDELGVPREIKCWKREDRYTIVRRESDICIVDNSKLNGRDAKDPREVPQNDPAMLYVRTAVHVLQGGIPTWTLPKDVVTDVIGVHTHLVNTNELLIPTVNDSILDIISDYVDIDNLDELSKRVLTMKIISRVHLGSLTNQEIIS